MPRLLSHIFLQEVSKRADFTARPGGGGRKPPERNRQAHGERLQRQWAAIWAKATAQNQSRSAVSKPTTDGIYIEFEGASGYELITKSLEDRRVGIRLLNVYTVPSGPNIEQAIVRATVFIPTGKEEYFLHKINQYVEENTGTGKPKNDSLLRSIEDIKLAMLESFWRDDFDLMPDYRAPAWCEIWIRDDGPTSREAIESSFRELSANLGIILQDRSLKFPDRTVLLGRLTRDNLEELIESSSYVAEFRRAKETARFFLELPNKDQTAWVAELLRRVEINPDAVVAVCILDTGANNGHFLLAPVLADSDCHTVEPAWKVDDHDGHGTMMCGVSAYGDILQALQHGGSIAIEHRLESAKILPRHGSNDPELYGEIVIQGLARAEIAAPIRQRIGCMAVTSEDGRDKGRPSSWSAAIDKVTSGCDDDIKRLLIVSAGNSDGDTEWARYPESNKRYSIHDPGQSWNALTVGAYTEKCILTDPDLQDHVPLAQPGQLSPFSSTSVPWDGKWPVKPDIVLEGGNVAKAPDGSFSQHDDLSVLSTGYKPTLRQFDSLTATSAATAQAAWMAAQIQTRYPGAWPETVRGLLIHSAEWPDALKKQFLVANSRGEYSKSDYGQLLRVCGYGVPTLSRALHSASNSLTLIAQAELQPFIKKVSGDCGTKDMHLHRLPWPGDVLLSMGAAPVDLRVTLSYFIEPGPGEVGWKDKYRYASHGLRFEVNSPGENEDRFLNRLNFAAREEGGASDSESRSQRWKIGSNSRNKGSVHSDIWTGTAADIAACNLIGIYPVGGWWRERSWLKRWGRRARYSLLVSLHTPDEKIDIYTPIAIKLDIPIEV